jgi:hypothetical protein
MPAHKRELTSNHRARLLPSAPVAREASMRNPVLLLLAMAAMMIAAPARAQTYDPNYPVCLQTYGIDGNTIECGYTSLPQCAQTASGRAAQCITNPYFAGTRAAGPRYRRSRRAY